MQNVLVINTVGFHVNGVSTVIMNLYNVTKERYNYDFTFPNYMDKKYLNQLDESNRLFKLGDRKKQTTKYITRLSKIIKKNRYDVIHIHGNSNTMLVEVASAKLAFFKGKIILHTHNTNVGKMNGVKGILNRVLINSASNILACGNEAGKALYGSLPFEIISNGIDLEEFSFNMSNRIKFREELNILPEDILIGHVGRMNEQKNQIFLLELMKYIPENISIKLALIGDGMNEDSLRKKAADLNITDTVFFLGSRENMNYVYSGLDVLVLPSKYEGIPLVIVEAQASGLPAIISDRVDKDVNVTNLISFLPIEEEDEVFKQWIDQIIQKANLKRGEDNSKKLLSDSGFDIQRSGDKINKIYKE